MHVGTTDGTCALLCLGRRRMECPAFCFCSSVRFLNQEEQGEYLCVSVCVSDKVFFVSVPREMMIALRVLIIAVKEATQLSHTKLRVWWKYRLLHGGQTLGGRWAGFGGLAHSIIGSQAGESVQNTARALPVGARRVLGCSCITVEEKRSEPLSYLPAERDLVFSAPYQQNRLWTNLERYSSHRPSSFRHPWVCRITWLPGSYAVITQGMMLQTIQGDTEVCSHACCS